MLAIDIKHKPTEGQEIALTQMLSWLDMQRTWVVDKWVEAPTSYTLSGSAGTGKTSVIQFLLQRYKKYSQTVVSAPTHKAKKVIAEKTGLQAYTIQKLLGLMPNTDIEDFNINKPNFDPKGEPQIKYFKLVIIDEASMLNDDLHAMIEKTAKQHKVKILYLGDKLQLPPVNEEISNVFNSNNNYELLEIVRQSTTNPLIELLAILRDDIINGTWNFKLRLTQLKGNNNVNALGEGIIVTEDKQEFADLLVADYSSSEAQIDHNHVRYCAWTNECVGNWNKYVRDKLKENSFGIANNNFIVPNDMLMSYNSISEDNEPVIVNSEDYIVQSTTKTVSKDNVSVYRTILNPIDDEGVVCIDIVDPEDYDHFMKVHTEYHQTAIERKGTAWVEYYKFKNKHLLLKDMRTTSNKLIVKKDIDYGYAITVHKTQGSTYTNIFVDGNNLSKNSNAVDCKKLWYVALSRPKKKAIILLT